MSRRALYVIVFDALFFSRSSALSVARLGSQDASLREDGQTHRNGSTVCVSLPVFEDPTYIDALLDNFNFFTEGETKIALHFDSVSDYDQDRIDGFASDRVAVTRERIEIKKIGGSILYAHLLNAKTFEEKWPGACDFFVMQSSNMMWVRKGMENAVRKHRYSQLQHGYGDIASQSGPFWDELMKKNNNGWGQPEGAFFPMGMLVDFNAFLDGWLVRTHQTVDDVLKIRVYLESFWLPTYALNFRDDLPTKSVGGNFALCYRHMVESNEHYDEDSVPLSEVKDIIRGEKFVHNKLDKLEIPAEQFYAVKRVNRDLHHPVTKFITSLSHRSADAP